jgi:hypothetical protein
MAAGDEGGNDERHLARLADDHALDVGQKPARRLRGCVALLGRLLRTSRFDHAGRKA